MRKKCLSNVDFGQNSYHTEKRYIIIFTYILFNLKKYILYVKLYNYKGIAFSIQVIVAHDILLMIRFRENMCFDESNLFWMFEKMNDTYLLLTNSAQLLSKGKIIWRVLTYQISPDF